MMYRIEARRADPSTEEGSAFAVFIGSNTSERRRDAVGAVRMFHGAGYWVEIFDDETRELLAGPFDPDLPLPSFIF